MVNIPVTHRTITRFVKQQEDEVCAPVELDKLQLKRLRHAGIKLTRQEWDKVMTLVNESLNDKYRGMFFNKQSRVQIVRQVTQIEREGEIRRMENLERVNDMLSVFTVDDFTTGTSEQNGSHWETMVDLVGELPDSNGLSTSNLDTIEEYDKVRDELEENIRQLKEVRSKIELTSVIRDKVATLNSQELNLQINEEMKSEFQRIIEFKI